MSLSLGQGLKKRALKAERETAHHLILLAPAFERELTN